jgi:hypothetical protein
MNHKKSIRHPRSAEELKAAEERHKMWEDIKQKARKLRQTKKWKLQAEEFKKGKVCWCCGSDQNLCVHHESNENYEVIDEKNCFVLCKGCHFRRHRKKYSLLEMKIFFSNPSSQKKYLKDSMILNRPTPVFDLPDCGYRDTFEYCDPFNDKCRDVIIDCFCPSGYYLVKSKGESA